MLRFCLLLAALFTGPVGFAACEDPAAPGVDWSGCDKRGLELRGVDLSNANFEGSRIGGDFTGANFSGANFLDAVVEGDFGEANFTHANFNAASIYGNFSFADFSFASFRGVYVSNADWRFANVTGIDLSFFDRANPIAPDLVSLIETDVIDSDLRGAFGIPISLEAYFIDTFCPDGTFAEDAGDSYNACTFYEKDDLPPLRTHTPVAVPSLSLWTQSLLILLVLAVSIVALRQHQGESRH